MNSTTDTFLHLNTSVALQSSQDSEQTPSSVQQVPTTVIRPIVFFSILDHFLRRNDDQDRVIGTLLGKPSEEKGVEITNCFPVPHSETEDQVEVDMEHHHTMLRLYRRVNPSEVIVGWYATGSGLNSYSALIQDFYNQEMGGQMGAVHLVLDTDMTDDVLGVRTFTSSAVGPFSKPENCLFVPIPYSLKYDDSDANGLRVLQEAKEKPNSVVSLLRDMDQLEQALLQVRAMLQRVSSYVDQVVAGTVKPNNVVGRHLMDLLAASPKIEGASFEKMFHNHLQDLLMAVYLSDLTRTQLNIASRLHKLV
ncbi:hypothetical protein IWQ61_001790 [Dispira simplex]|nr:hypothetical protein IWQ61_001790 [Dispira simplex]